MSAVDGSPVVGCSTRGGASPVVEGGLVVSGIVSGIGSFFLQPAKTKATEIIIRTITKARALNFLLLMIYYCELSFA
jgi:hypothetical protein